MMVIAIDDKAVFQASLKSSDRVPTRLFIEMFLTRFAQLPMICT